MSYIFLTKQKKGSGRRAIEAPSDDSPYLRFRRTKPEAENDQTSLFIFNSELLGLDDEQFSDGFHVQIGTDHPSGMVALLVREDLPFEIIPPEYKVDDDGSRILDDDGNPQMTQERVVSRGKTVYNARKVGEDSAYLTVSSGGTQVAQIFDIPPAEDIWVPLSYNDEHGVWEGNLREIIDRLDS